MKTQHLSPRALKRAIERASNRKALADSRLAATGKNGRTALAHHRRLETLRTELASRPNPEAHKWTMKPGEVIKALREVHGIGPTLATRVKRRRRLIARLKDNVFSTQAYLLRVERRVREGKEPESKLVEAGAALARFRRELEAARASVLPAPFHKAV